jgi:hypothetical protein
MCSDIAQRLAASEIDDLAKASQMATAGIAQGFMPATTVRLAAVHG